ncbi:hypothetical protein Rs2_20895 [Raphanus sativus]|nr:hypothetical protein Rs2_20895 [Raphanus sativus]
MRNYNHLFHKKPETKNNAPPVASSSDVNLKSNNNGVFTPYEALPSFKDAPNTERVRESGRFALRSVAAPILVPFFSLVLILTVEFRFVSVVCCRCGHGFVSVVCCRCGHGFVGVVCCRCGHESVVF